METMEIKTAILHGLDMDMGGPIISQVELAPEDFLNEYISKRLVRLQKSEQSRISTARSINGLSLDQAMGLSDWQQFHPFTVDLLKKIAEFRKGNGGQSADVLMALLEVDRHLCFYTAVLDYRRSLIHQISQDDNYTRMELVEYSSALPAASASLSFEFCTDLFTGQTSLIEKKDRGFTPLSEIILSRQFDMTPKEKIKAAQQIVQQVHAGEDLDEMNHRVQFKQKVSESLKENEEVDLEQIFEEIYVDQPSTLYEVKAKLQDQGLDQKRLTVSSSPYDSKLKKQKLVTDSGIQITLPIDFVTDSNHVEFITNPDGSMSILLKNITHIYDK